MHWTTKGLITYMSWSYTENNLFTTNGGQWNFFTNSSIFPCLNKLTITPPVLFTWQHPATRMVGNDTPLWIVPANQQETHFRHFIDRGANLDFRGKLTTVFDRSQDHGDLDGEDHDGADDERDMTMRTMMKTGSGRLPYGSPLQSLWENRNAHMKSADLAKNVGAEKIIQTGEGSDSITPQEGNNMGGNDMGGDDSEDSDGGDSDSEDY